MADGIGALPRKPSAPGENASESKRLQYQEKMQAYWFAVNQQQNMLNQEATQKSNLQKSSHDAMMAMAQNLK